jgi:hypothetical protein
MRLTYIPETGMLSLFQGNPDAGTVNVITTLDCLACFLRQAIETIRMSTDDPAQQEAWVREILGDLAHTDLQRTPPAIGAEVHRRIRELSGLDPFLATKRLCNAIAAKALPEARAMVEAADDPFEMAVRFAVAGNTIDAGQGRRLDEDFIHRALLDLAHVPVDHEAISRLESALSRAEAILVLGDNCGEIYFDRLLLEQILRLRDGAHAAESITYAVRGGVTINDATLADAEEAGLLELVPVIDNGSDIPGTDLAMCSDAFVERFHHADLVLAKGQGNYETLSDAPGNIWFLLRAKCAVVARDARCPEGAFLVLHRGGDSR